MVTDKFVGLVPGPINFASADEKLVGQESADPDPQEFMQCCNFDVQRAAAVGYSRPLREQLYPNLCWTEAANSTASPEVRPQLAHPESSEEQCSAGQRLLVTDGLVGQHEHHPQLVGQKPRPTNIGELSGHSGPLAGAAADEVLLEIACPKSVG